MKSATNLFQANGWRRKIYETRWHVLSGRHDKASRVTGRDVTKIFAQIFIHTSELVFVSIKPKRPTVLSPVDSESCYGIMRTELWTNYRTLFECKLRQWHGKTDHTKLPDTITHDHTFVYHNGWPGSIVSPEDGQGTPETYRDVLNKIATVSDIKLDTHTHIYIYIYIYIYIIGKYLVNGL
jgi:hypothetical protein